jgi:site-specific recombinase XerD
MKKHRSSPTAAKGVRSQNKSDNVLRLAHLPSLRSMTDTHLLSQEFIDKQARFEQIFEAWADSRANTGVTDRPLGPVTADIYREMWSAFSTFCIEHRLQYDQLRSIDLSRFFEQRQKARAASGEYPNELNARYARRFLTLIDRVLRHAAEQQGCQPNIAAAELLEQPEYKHAEAADRDPLPEYLSPEQSEDLIRYLRNQYQLIGTESVHWKEARDCAAVGLMLGAGLAPGDVRSLRINGIFMKEDGEPWKLSVPGNGNSPARETPVAGWAGSLLRTWMEEHRKQRLAGDYVFPATMSGKQWSQSRCFESCKAVLERAGVDDVPGGLFKLRHTFVLRQLEEGHVEADIARWLGLLDISGMNRYKRIVRNEVTLR